MSGWLQSDGWPVKAGGKRWQLILPAVLAEDAADLRVAQQATDAQILISVDQAEELFAEAEAADVCCFFSILGSALQSPFFQAVITLRPEWLAFLQAADGLAIPLQEVSLSPLPIERMAESITDPARVAGIRVDEAYVQAELRDARIVCGLQGRPGSGDLASDTPSLSGSGITIRISTGS